MLREWCQPSVGSHGRYGPFVVVVVVAVADVVVAADVMVFDCFFLMMMSCR